MREIKQILNKEYYPIVHLKRNDNCCPDCNSSSNEHCSHFIVVTSLNIEAGFFTCRLVTHSSCCGNVLLYGQEYELNKKYSYFIFKYISSNDNFFSLDCLYRTDLVRSIQISTRARFLTKFLILIIFFMLEKVLSFPICNITNSCKTINKLSLISNTIKQARKAQKLSKEDLASSVYLKLSAFKKWEKDPSLMPVYILLDILDILNIKLSLETEVNI